ncbi:MAG: undecaprenyldiphospho-muramoylpentapeptide beta-N-acetylglucosaminyltransferase [Ruminococcaceae bacterium]|nr:undecaprenyldiphospho-muramoylpentapeptide beta-N-acetylglucosaminyltransferase [Oscillospiraceae bacterium]
METALLFGGYMRVLMTGGGTGGHVNPALAIAQIIKENQPDSVIEFVGTEKGIENTLVPKAGYKLHYINIQGIRRSLSPSNLKTAYLVMTSPRKAARIIDEFRPDVVIGTGGYVCWPLLYAAAKKGIPTVVHESNAYAGVAVRQLKNKVDVIMTNFEATATELSESSRAKVIKVGNPVSTEFGRITKKEARIRLGIPESAETVILSFGGSLGSVALNDAVVNAMRHYTADRSGIVHYHSLGRVNGEDAKRRIAEYALDKKENLFISEYIYDMPIYMAAADIIVCRAGAMTLSELAAVRCASIIIPSPNVTDNHQYKNAKVLSDAGAAVLLEESSIKEKTLADELMRLVENKAAREEMADRVSSFYADGVGKTIYSEILKLTESKNK